MRGPEVGPKRKDARREGAERGETLLRSGAAAHAAPPSLERVTAPMSNGTSAASALRLSFSPGTVIEGKYRIERPIGEGDMGCVFLARHVRSGEPVALKFMHPIDASESPAAFACFLQAARAAARFRSDHVAHVRDMGMLEDGAPYLVMEYLEGEVIEGLLRARGPLSLEEAVDHAMQASFAMRDAHAAGVLHLDLKPSNWFLAVEPDGSLCIKLLDFGGSKVAGTVGGLEDPRSPSQVPTGTPPYSSPEQVRCAPVDRRSDIWSIGVVLYEMLAGVPPFAGETVMQLRERVIAGAPTPLRSVRSDVPGELEAIVMRCLDKVPDERYPDTVSLARALAPYVSGAPRAARAVPASTPPPPPVEVPASAESEPQTTLQEEPQAPVAHPAPSHPETLSPESAPLAIVSPVVSTRPPAREASTRSARRPGLRSLPKTALVVGAGALAVAAAVLAAGASGNPDAPSASRAEAAPQASALPVPALPALPASPAPPAAMPAPEPVQIAAPTAEVVVPSPPLPSPTPPLPRASALPEPSATHAAARAPAATKAPSTTAPPVSTVGFGERE